MKIRVLWLLSLAAFITSTVLAAPSKSSGSSGTVHVKGYTRKDGTYVAPNDRTAPNSTKNDNWSTKGNVNPETGKKGTKPGDSGTNSAEVSSTTKGTSAGSATKAAAPETTTTSSAQTPPASTVDLTKISLGMSKTQVLAQTGEPNIKTESSWFYMERGWVRFKSGTVVTAIEAR